MRCATSLAFSLAHNDSIGERGMAIVISRTCIWMYHVVSCCVWLARMITNSCCCHGLSKVVSEGEEVQNTDDARDGDVLGGSDGSDLDISRYAKVYTYLDYL